MANALSPPLTAFKSVAVIKRLLVLQQDTKNTNNKGNHSGSVEASIFEIASLVFIL